MTGRPIVPPATFGVLGGGQLGRYTVIAARTMGYRTVVLEPDASSPAGTIADEHLVAPYDDRSALERMSVACDVVTTEFENAPAAALERLTGSVTVAPSAEVVAIAQDRLQEKAFLVDNGFPVGRYRAVHGVDDLTGEIGPSILKSARLGYDGRGQRAVERASDALAAWAELGGVPCVLEQRLALDAEISVVLARRHDGGTAAFDVAENVHVAGILDLTVVPARVAPPIADRATGIALAIADALDYVGVLAVEMFVVDGEVLVNELAPRPHNSGHWTLDAARTSQFEQQVRAVCGVALGDPSRTAPAVAMVNLLGDLWATGEPMWRRTLDDSRAKLHLYGKSVPRPGRKMGHLTVTGHNANEVADRALRLRDELSRPG